MEIESVAQCASIFFLFSSSKKPSVADPSMAWHQKACLCSTSTQNCLTILVFFFSISLFRLFLREVKILLDLGEEIHFKVEQFVDPSLSNNFLCGTLLKTFPTTSGHFVFPSLFTESSKVRACSRRGVSRFWGESKR